MDERLVGDIEWAGGLELIRGVGIALVLVAMLGDRLELVDASSCSSWVPWKVGSTQVGNALRGDMAVDTCTCCCSLDGCRLLLVGMYCSRSKPKLPRKNSHGVIFRTYYESFARMTDG